MRRPSVGRVALSIYPINVGKVWYHHDTFASEKSPTFALDGRDCVARRAAATAGCAVSLRNFGQAEPKRVDHMDGNQSCSKLGQNGEYRPLR